MAEENAPPRITWPMLCHAINDLSVTDDDLGSMLRLWAVQAEATHD